MLDKLLKSLGNFIETIDTSNTEKLARLLESNSSSTVFNTTTILLIKQIAKERNITEYAVVEEALNLTNIPLTEYSSYRQALINRL